MEPVTAAAASEEQVTRRVASRIIRALQHQLRLLHRAGAEFFVLGATGNVYTVTLATTPACTCPDPAVPCKHILFVLLRVLGLSLDEACVWRQSLRPCQVARLAATPTCGAADVMAGPRARERFHQLWSARAAAAKAEQSRRRREEAGASAASSGRRDGAACPVCLEEMSPLAQQQAQGGATAAPAPQPVLLTCGTCRNSVHAECFARWKRSRARRAATCVVCRARWRQPSKEQEQQQYMNLAEYMNDAAIDGDVEMVADDGGLCAG
ncbi:mitogen-activated protein kinase kinase kinase 1 [Oryza brachyantha]|uniref:mitogen-activated protein kinase kinase kinase 1 n=1 Tax=Oryza brachyantha TaxID=4533 RepID=UPI001ADBBA00|nr:mitogen-activated protein kinase kinase kinase 1 [Oryza brachyantha]